MMQAVRYDVEGGTGYDPCSGGRVLMSLGGHPKVEGQEAGYLCWMLISLRSLQ